jgi:hypothetical protein
MNTVTVPDGATDVDPHPRSDDVFWCHRAFCGLALPAPWSRQAGGSSVSITPDGPDGSLPSGKLLRLLLLWMCDAAVPARDPVVPVGDGPGAWSRDLGMGLSGADFRDLSLQLERLVGSRIVVCHEGGPALAVLDARGRPRAGGGLWGSSLRLNSRFLARLLEAPVPLSRDAVGKLWRTPEALDAYA